MVKKLAVPLIASMLGFAALTASAEVINLNDQERMELRQRADDLRAQNALGGTRSSAGGEVRSHHAKPMKVKHGKHHKKHAHRSHDKRRT